MVQAAVTLALAFLGFGYWALVLGILSFSVTPTCLVLLWRRQSFAFPRWSSIRRAIRYSRHILVGRLSWALYNDSDFIVAGRVLGEAPLGVYTLAWTLAHTPLEKLTTLVNRVTPSVFAKIQTDPDELRRYLRNITGVMALIIFPVTIGMALVAPEFVPLILGAKWMGVILPLEILVLHALVRSNVILIVPLLNVIGEERLVMWNSLGLHGGATDFVLYREPLGDGGHRRRLGGGLSFAAASIVFANLSKGALSSVRIRGDDVAGGKRLCGDGTCGCGVQVAWRRCVAALCAVGRGDIDRRGGLWSGFAGVASRLPTGDSTLCKGGEGGTVIGGAKSGRLSNINVRQPAPSLFIAPRAAQILSRAFRMRRKGASTSR